ncbi:MAG: hybrid sensor histidine kinase/response regulator [Gemmatimonadetes bacterium]|nr:MAG: hybrid sensor histidine kinase/response regulator [Gemmatimonadota bacterium]
MSPHTAWERGGGPRDWLIAAVLGGLALLLNQWKVPLLTEETPTFLFGGAVVLVAFARCGLGPGLLAAALSLADNFLALPAAHEAATVVYLVEGVVAALLYRRLRSLILAVGLFWLTLGWLFDLVLYGGLVGLSWEYGVLLFVKQFVNGLTNATAAEAILFVMAWLDARRAPVSDASAPPLQAFTFSRVALVAMIPALAAGVIYTRTAYDNRLAATMDEASRAASAVEVAVRDYLEGVGMALEQAARRIEARGPWDGAPPPEFAELVERHPEIVKLGVTDRAGIVRAMLPEADASGQSLVGADVSRMPYFGRLLERGATVFSRVFYTPVALSEHGRGRWVAVVGEPIFGPDGQIAGSLLAAIDPASMGRLLAVKGVDEAVRITLFDDGFRVAASTAPDRPTGYPFADHARDGEGRALAGSLAPALADESSSFTYYPPAGPTVESHLGLDLVHARYRRLSTSDWGVLVDVPAQVLHARMLPTSYMVVAFLTLAFGLLYLGVLSVSRAVASPLEAVDRTATAVAAGALSATGDLEALAAHPVAELRSVGRQLLAMRDALARRAEETLQRELESQERFQVTFEQAAVGIAHRHPDGSILRVNRKYAELIGVEPEALVGLNPERWVADEDRAAERRALQDVAEGRRPTFTLEKRLRRPDGIAVWVQSTVSLTRDDEGEPRYFIEVIQDLTEHKELELRLLQSQKLEAIGLLAGGVAHDFNNLLTPIIGYADLAVDEARGNAELEEALREIRAAAVRAKDLTWQLLAFGRKQVLEMQAVDVGEVVRQFEAMIRRIFRENIEICVEVDDGVGAVRADPAQIQQILMNLAVNAQDAMPSGGRLTIRAHAVDLSPAEAGSRELEPGPHVRLVVSDTGEGIHPESLSQIFEPFFTTKELGKGTGLGLSTVYGIVKQHGGSVTVSSRVGEGTTFEVYLPRAAAEAPATNGTHESVEAGGGSETVVVVEDEQAVRRLVTTALRGRGYRVVEAGSAEEVIEWARRGGSADLVLSDVILPGMNGRDLCDELRRLNPGTKVLYMSGYSDTVLSQDGMLDPGTHLLPKPFTIGGLARRVREVLDA